MSRTGPIGATWSEDAVAAVPSLRTLGTSATSAAAGNDSRLSDSRTPTAHAASHFIGGSDALSELWLFPWQRRIVRYHCDIGATTIQTDGAAAPTTDGSLANADDDGAPWLSFVTGAVSGNTAGMYGTFASHRVAWKPSLLGRIRTGGSVASIRLWFGLFFSDPQTLGSVAGIHAAGIGYDTGTDGTAFWHVVTSNGAAQTRTATSVAIATATAYNFWVLVTSTEVKFYIDDVLVRTETATLPTANLGPAIRVTTLTGSSKRWSFDRLHLLSV